MIHQFLS